MKNIIIVCDGSSLGNGRGETRAAAAVLEFNGKCKRTVNICTTIRINKPK